MGLLPPSTPWEMICRGSPLELAMINDVVLENPIWSEPESTAGTIAAPPAASCGWIVSFWALKNPFWTPR